LKPIRLDYVLTAAASRFILPQKRSWQNTTITDNIMATTEKKKAQPMNKVG
jgi:hypothetical protein